MLILPIDASLQRVILQGNYSPEGLRLTLGQQIVATVLKINEEGQLLLGLGTKKVAARSQLPLAEGQQLHLRVQQNGSTIELQLVDSTAQSATENYELATVVQRLASAGGATTLESDPARLLDALQQLLKHNGQLLTEPQNRQLKSLLEPITAGPVAKSLIPQVQNSIQNSGIFFEAKLRAILDVFNASPEAALAKLDSDLKLLLGHLRQLPLTQLSSTPVGTAQTGFAATPSNPANLEQPAVLLTAATVSESASPLAFAGQQLTLPEHSSALQTLSYLATSAPDETMRKLAAKLLALLQVQPERDVAEPRAGPLDALAQQPGTPRATQQVPSHTSSLSQNLSPSAQPFRPSSDLDQLLRQLLQIVRATPSSEKRTLATELAALLARTEESGSSLPKETPLAQAAATVLDGSSFSLERRLSRQCQDWRGFHRNRRHGVA